MYYFNCHHHQQGKLRKEGRDSSVKPKPKSVTHRSPKQNLRNPKCFEFRQLTKFQSNLHIKVTIVCTFHSNPSTLKIENISPLKILNKKGKAEKADREIPKCHDLGDRI